MRLVIPFVELNKFRKSAETKLCDAVMDYCEQHGISVEFYSQITRPVCTFIARSIGVEPDNVIEWRDAGNYPDLDSLAYYAPDFLYYGFNREKYMNLMIERSEHLVIETMW